MQHSYFCCAIAEAVSLWSLVSQRGGQEPILGQVTWDLWWTD